MIILGIETSCDETAAAVVKDGKKILSNVVASSMDIHKESGGIIPEQAARQQITSIIPVIQKAIKDSGLKIEEIDAIAVTEGPGLIGSLLVGVEAAKTLSSVWKKPLIPVNHLWGHIYAAWLEKKTKPEFPAVVLIVSGGHTDLFLMKNHGEVKWLGGTRDDAAGEAFDKTARILGLGYPGGPEISKKAEGSTFKKLTKYPRPLINSDDFDFSFSGLKTSVMRNVEKNNVENEAAEIQEAIVDVLAYKTLKAVKKNNPKSLIISGGVAANKRLRTRFVDQIMEEGIGVHMFVPEPKYCTDNAVMIASAAHFLEKQVPWKKVSANPQLSLT